VDVDVDIGFGLEFGTGPAQKDVGSFDSRQTDVVARNPKGAVWLQLATGSNSTP
jgi:hypothetical protein